MTNHSPIFTSSSATGTFSEYTNTTGSSALHTLTGTMNFTDSDHSDTHTTTAALKSATVSGGTFIPASVLAHFQTAMTSQKLSDSNGTGKIRWTFNDADNDFDFLSKNQTLVLTYDIKVFDNHGGSVTQTVKVTVTGTDDGPQISTTAVATVTEQANKTLSFSTDTVHVALAFTDADLANTGHTATVLSASATGNTSGIIFGNAQLMAYFDVDNVVKNGGSSSGVINTTFSAPDLSFDYLAAGEHLDITYVVRLDDHAGGVSTQNVQVTVVGTNDAPFYICGPQTEHLVEGQDVNSSGNLHADGDLLFTDIDLSDAHTVSTTVTATRTGGGAIPLTNAELLAAFSTSLSPDSTGHLIGDVDWDFMLQNSAASFLQSGETLTLVYHVTIEDPSLGSDTQDVTITILGTNHGVVITSGPESASVFELADTTGSAAIDTTTTAPAGTLDFTDADTGDTHTVTTTLVSTSGGPVPSATQADLAAAISTTLHDSTGTGAGSVDWDFAIADQDLDYLAEGETLTVNYNVKVSDASTDANQTVSVVVTGANDAVAITSGPDSATVAEQPDTVGSTTLDTSSTGTLAFADVDLSDAHSVSVALDSAVWSAGEFFVPADTLDALQTALMTTLQDSTGSGAGGIDWTFAIQDKNLDFLSPGETLTATYSVTVSDGITTSTQQVTITATGAEDPIVVNPLDVAVNDTFLRDEGNIVASGNAILDAFDRPGDSSSTLSITDVNGQGTDTTVAGTYGSLFIGSDGTFLYTANAAFDLLQVGVNPTDQFSITVSDGHGHSEVTTLTFNIAGGSDAPVITSTNALGSVTEDAGPTVAVNGGFESGDLTGYSSSGVSVDPLFIGGEFGNYSARLSGTGFLEQDPTTVAGQHYIVSFYVAGDAEASASSLQVFWDGAQILSQTDVTLGFTKYTFDLVGDALDPTTQLFFDFSTDGTGILIDQISITPTPGPAVETTSGSIAFTDIETADTHTASFTADGSGYVGTFSLDPVSESGGSGSLAWHYSVDNADIQFLAQGQTLVQTYSVTVTDDHGASTLQTVTIAIDGTNDAPTAVSDTIISDAGPNGTVIIAPWALAANDTDPDTTDQLFVNSIGTSTGGSGGGAFGFVFFSDDATLGGSFTYDAGDGHATSGNFATVNVVNNATTTTTLTGTGANEIIIATQGNEALDGGGGNDILFGFDGDHLFTGGTGNDTFAFQSQPTGANVIADFNNTTEQDHIAVSANSFGGGLTAGMDLSSVFETSGDDQFSGSGAVFHFDTANETLYFSADGTTASAITLVQVQAGVTINPHDLLIV
ncbi:VCBS domain-containing protein [Bradyrhizobium sp.]|jgi:VCBS repeat-containing protein|uniref:beta strand repeat-containing protein n=1 Tax=Bradyrhizobium sp. TaxID=376 RepID=UPI002E0BF8E3|nr:VCBS domain-containing protein [Bradyrhizobium sp.]